jgi:hypothetical protein
VTDSTEATELTVEDILGDTQDVAYSPILKMWREILLSSKTVRKERITPQWATRIVSTHADLGFADMPHYRDLYYAKLDELLDGLQAELDTDENWDSATTPEEDAEQNNLHYLNVIISWQKTILSWELDWNCEQHDAAIELAAISEVHKMFFGSVGLTSLLDQIDFEFTETAQELLRAELEEMKTNWDSNE